MPVFCLVGEKYEEELDRGMFDDDATILPLEETDISMAHLLARLGKFPSVSQARKNGWDRPIPRGWSEFTIGKGVNRWDLYIYDPEWTQKEFEELFPD